jgi:hypothetical protein
MCASEELMMMPDVRMIERSSDPAHQETNENV